MLHRSFKVLCELPSHFSYSLKNIFPIIFNVQLNKGVHFKDVHFMSIFLFLKYLDIFKEKKNLYVV